MKKMDERNLQLLNETIEVGEQFSARQALEKMVLHLSSLGRSTMYVPHANRLSHILRQSSQYKVHERNASRSHTMYERIN
jgi:hypothetical protein